MRVYVLEIPVRKISSGRRGHLAHNCDVPN